jgi:RNA polymerase sigma factor (sigma-70 family)
MMDDAELRHQLEQLHEMSYGWALNCCSFQPNEAEDILQTVYQKVLEGRARYHGKSLFKTWLFAVIRNTAANERRRRWLRAFRLVDYARERDLDCEPSRAAGIGGDVERLAIFRSLLGKLPQRQREVLHLVFYQDHTIEAASVVMGVSLGSARTHYERAKHRLAEWIKQTGHFDEYLKQ